MSEQRWQIGDCLDIMQQYPDNHFDLVLTDPPYNINYKTNRRISKNKKSNLTNIKKEHTFTKSIHNDIDNDCLIERFVSESYRLLKNNTAFYCFCSPDKIDQFKIEIEKQFTIKNIIIWVKNNWTAGDLEAQYGKQYEMIIYANKGRRKMNGKRLSDVWMFDKVAPTESVHQNQKPLKLIERILSISSKKGDKIIDPFCGSGTILEACMNLDLDCLAVDISDEWVDHYKKRLMTDNSKLDAWL